ncbi:hypothetical protein TNCV_2663161 [Trichonephila clavipes]|nr:hypothetical protein TNCV_2663161 [Trichonephila clavipes]
MSKDTFEKDMGSKIKKNKESKDKDEGIITSLLRSFPRAAGTDEYLKMEATLSAFENFLQTADAKRLKGSSPMLMEFLIPIFHIFSGLVVKKLPSSSVSPSGPPTEDRSDAPSHEALDNAYNTSEIWKSKWLYPKENYRNLRAVSTRSFLVWLHTLNQPFPV